MKAWILAISMVLASMASMAPALASNTPLPAVNAQSFRDPNSLSAAYFKLAHYGHLISQMDPRLRQRGLVLPNGGLCVTASFANLTLSLISNLGLPIQSSKLDQMVDVYVKFYRENYKADARLGAYVHRFSRVFESLSRTLTQAGVPVETSTQHYASVPDALTIYHAIIDPQSLIIATVQFKKRSARMANDLHAVVVLDIDPVNQLILVSDPNRPHHVFYSKYRESAQGVTFEIFPIFGEPVAEVVVTKMDHFRYRKKPRY